MSCKRLLLLLAFIILVTLSHGGRQKKGRRSGRPGSAAHIARRPALRHWTDATRRDSGDASPPKCEVAKVKCAYRVGCGMALQKYMVGCAEVMSGKTKVCSDHCRNTLVALTSTEEGKALMECECSDDFCRESKERVQVCRDAVLLATQNDTIVTCSVAQWICAADPLCSTALDYYNRFCRAMFSGRKCSNRCNNSISILQRQEKAAKLATCRCDGREAYNCRQIKDNMETLCFRREPVPTATTTTESPHTSSGGGYSRTSVLMWTLLLHTLLMSDFHYR